MTFAPTALAALLLACGTLLPVAGRSTRAAEDAPAAAANLNRARRVAAFEQHVLTSYAHADLVRYRVPADVYRQALLGYYSLQRHGAATQPVLTIIDFARPSHEKRLWVIDVQQERVLFHTLVAHGRNSGDDQARAFSNVEGSEMSSLGFYVTGQTYQGKHGLSLKLHGQDDGYNTNALARAVVVHGADYVSEAFVRQHGRLGRSQGCPALPVAETPAIIRAIRNGSVVFAHAPSGVPFVSEWLQLDDAATAYAQQRPSAGS